MLTLASPQLTIDQVVAAVDGAAITASDVEQEYKLETFLESGHVPAPVSLNDAAFGRVLERLIDQKLLERELQQEGMKNLNVPRSVAERLEEIHKKMSNDQAFDSALRSLNIDEDQLRRKLEGQQRIAQMIDRRLRPDAKPAQAEIEAYYRTTFLAELAKNAIGSPPPLKAVEGRITEILTQKKIGDLMDSWIKQLRSTHRIKILYGGR